MVKPVRKSSNKNPPILSHEFVIQNHADIVSCVAMVFVVGLMVQATTPLASVFITLHHNVTGDHGDIPLYLPGFKDTAAVFFYSLICIIVHAILQEYVLDKISKKLHLSKSKLAIFSTSGQLSAFYLLSAGWGLDIALREHLIPDFGRIWSEYPTPMFFLFKMYIIVQLAYSLHELPELYFQKVKKEEWTKKGTLSLAGFVLVLIPYVLNFNRLLVVLLVLNHTAQLVYHGAQLLQTVDKEEKFTKVTRLASTVVQIVACLGSTIIAVLTLWYGLSLRENQVLDIQNGQFNVPLIRFSVLAGIIVLQTYLIFKVFSQEISRSKESVSATTVPKPRAQKKEKSKKAKKSEESDLPEVDQNTNKNLRKQKVK
ncbi:translocating chain-associated membrane protein 1-like 1 [Sitophilus oryzae]|uniref:Translocating chain-associated membrane protein 1-like 1 n=1 Tax=Sitophilus oryzae TaxID=7048 RepID=A0A6J2XLA1_SITOR|nr:translocating chain-associated membrane protein 1-like 1 [Sitophilus oryzae]